MYLFRYDFWLLQSTMTTESKSEISNYIKLNIGGSLFYTTVTTLSKLNSKLRDLVLSQESDNNELSESEGMIVAYILNIILLSTSIFQ